MDSSATLHLKDKFEIVTESPASKSILCLWAIGWSGLWQRHQQIMSRLASSHRILYVESPRDPFSVTKGLIRGQMRVSQILGPRKVLDGVYVFSPVVPFSLRRYPRLNYIYLSLLLPYLKLLMRSLQMKRPVLWVSYPPAEFFVGKMGEEFACYDCCDDLTDIPAAMARIIQDQEFRLLKKVKMVFVTSEPLFKKISVIHSNVHMIPNGADFQHFSKAQIENLSCPQELQDFKKPVIGFIGSVQHWVDTDLIAHAARSRPGWSWVIIGGVHTDISPLKGIPNVHLLGQKSYGDLPDYLRHIDVCTVPFKQKQITHAADPIKVYEYLAAGKPVVSMAIPRIEVFGKAVRIARDEYEFVAHIGKALKEDSESDAKSRMEIARSHSWDSRIERILTLWYSDNTSDKSFLKN